MPYGMPCPDDVQPDAIFPLVADADTALAQFVSSLEQWMTQALFVAQGNINQSINTLSDWIRRQIGNVNRSLSQVWETLSSQLTASNFVGTVNLSTAISSIAQSLHTTDIEVINGPSIPSPLNPPFGPTGPPTTPTQPAPYPPIVLPSNPPTQPPTIPNAPTCPIPRKSLNIGGAYATATAICYPVTLPAPITLNNIEYDPTFTVYYTGRQLGTSPVGTPTLPISYDIQFDGSMVINVGPISIHMRLPASTIGQPDAVCQLPGS